MTAGDTHPLTGRPLFRGELMGHQTCVPYCVWEPLGAGQEVAHRFDDEDLAMQCAVHLGRTVERADEVYNPLTPRV